MQQNIKQDYFNLHNIAVTQNDGALKWGEYRGK